MDNPNSNAPAGGTSTDQNDGVNDGKKTETFTQAQVNDLIQKRVNDLNAKHEKDIEARLAAEKADWERKSKLTEDERQTELRNEQIKQLEERERAVTMRERKAEAEELLRQKDISADLAELVLLDADADKTAKNVELFADRFNKAVEAGVAAKLAGKTPIDGRAVPKGKPATSNGVISRNGVVAF